MLVPETSPNTIVIIVTTIILIILIISVISVISIILITVAATLNINFIFPSTR
jgi:hypothetical protein